MFNSEFNKLMKAYHSIILQQKQKVFNEEQCKEIFKLLKNNNDAVAFKTQFQQYVEKNGYKGTKFPKSIWDSKFDPLITKYCKQDNTWNQQQLGTNGMAEVLGFNSQSQLVTKNSDIVKQQADSERPIDIIFNGYCKDFAQTKNILFNIIKTIDCIKYKSRRIEDDVLIFSVVSSSESEDIYDILERRIQSDIKKRSQRPHRDSVSQDKIIFNWD